MGYKGKESKDIQIDVKKDGVKKQILDAYLPKAQRAEVDKEFKELEKELKQKQEEEVIKKTKGEMAELEQTIKEKNNLLDKYSEVWSKNVTLESMQKRVSSVGAEVKDGNEISLIKKQGAVLVFPLQIALNRAGYNIKVDGIYGKNTEDALNAYKTSLEKSGNKNTNILTTLSALLDPTWAPAQEKKDTNPELLTMQPEDIEHAGDDLFKQGNFEGAAAYYGKAGAKYKLLNPSIADKANPFYIHGVNTFLNIANTMLSDGKRNKQGSMDFYQRGVVKDAKNLLMHAKGVNLETLNSLLLDAKRTDLVGVRTLQDAEADLARAQKEVDRLAKVSSTDAAVKLTKKEAQSALDAYTKEVEFYKSKTVIDQPTVAAIDKENSTDDTRATAYIDAYVNSYFGPILPTQMGGSHTVQPVENISTPAPKAPEKKDKTGKQPEKKKTKKVVKAEEPKVEKKVVNVVPVIIDGQEVSGMSPLALVEKGFALQRDHRSDVAEKYYQRAILVAGNDVEQQNIIANNIGFHAAQLLTEGKYEQAYNYAKIALEFGASALVKQGSVDRFMAVATHKDIPVEQRVQLYNYAKDLTDNDSVRNGIQDNINNIK